MPKNFKNISEVKTSKNTKHVYKINFATIILRYEADMQSVFLSYTKNDLNSLQVYL